MAYPVKVYRMNDGSCIVGKPMMNSDDRTIVESCALLHEEIMTDEVCRVIVDIPGVDYNEKGMATMIFYHSSICYSYLANKDLTELYEKFLTKVSNQES